MCGECRFYFQNTGNSRSAAFAARITNPFGLTNVGSYSSPSFVDIDGDNFFEAIIGNGAGRLVFFESDILVPVEFTFFKGQATKAGNLLTWQTASEVNNEGFHIERSEDAKSWKAIGFVKGNGTTAETQDYSFLDSASVSGGRGRDVLVKRLYYRLKQMDFDGQYEYSDIIVVNGEWRMVN